MVPAAVVDDAVATTEVDVVDVEKSCGVKRLFVLLLEFVVFVLLLVVLALLLLLFLNPTWWSDPQTDDPVVVPVSYELFVCTTLQSSESFSQSENEKW